MDALSAVLKTVHLEGAVYLNAEFTAPWCVRGELGFASVRKRLAGKDQVPVEAVDKQMNKLLARGQLLTTDNQIDLTSGTLKLKAQLPNSDGLLFPNEFVVERLLVNTVPGATVAPATAIQRGPFACADLPRG